MEQSLVLIKPDGVERNLVGEIIGRLENRGLKILAMKMLIVPEKLARQHYDVHLGKPFYEGLIKYISSGPVVAMVLEGPEAISAIRQTVGSTNPLEASAGTIRHDFALVTSRNLIHASDSKENAAIEISNWFSQNEIFSWERSHENWFTGKN